DGSVEDDPGEAYRVVRGELEAYGAGLIDKPEIVALSKCDALTEEMIAEKSASLEAACGQKPLILSSASGLNVDRALRMIVRAIDRDKQDAANQVPAPEQEGWHP
ncbi:MAG: GTPase ObgE, partial [Roseibium sp.]